MSSTKKIKYLFLLSTLLGFLGVISLIFAWSNQQAWNFSRLELILNGIALILLAMWFTLWIVVYQHFLTEEMKNFADIFLNYLKTIINIFKKSRSK